MHIFWRKNLFLVLPIFVVFTIFFFASVNAAFNPEINYQGKLYGFDDRPVLDANYQMRFELFTELEGGAAIWTEDRTTTPNLVPLRNGLFSVMLGEVENLSGVDFNQPLYLQVSVGTSSLEVMSPRKKLGAVPAAFTSAKLDGKTWEAPGAIGTETATTAIFTNITSTGASFTNNVSLNGFKIENWNEVPLGDNYKLKIGLMEHNQPDAHLAVR